PNVGTNRLAFDGRTDCLVAVATAVGRKPVPQNLRGRREWKARGARRRGPQYRFLFITPSRRRARGAGRNVAQPGGSLQPGTQVRTPNSAIANDRPASARRTGLC